MIYLEGYKQGNNAMSWRADLFFKGEIPLCNIKMNLKELKEKGFIDKSKIHQCDYFVLQNY